MKRVYYLNMILSAEAIEEAIQKGELVIDPFDTSKLKGASYTFTLGNTFLSSSGEGPIDLRQGEPIFMEKPLPDRYLLEPGAFGVFLTAEKIYLPKTIACILSTRGHIAQLGIDFLQTSIFCEPEKTIHQIKLEARNGGNRPVVLRPGMSIVKGIFMRVEK